MKEYQVIIGGKAKKQLAELYDYIALNSSSQTAFNYTEGIVDYCESLKTFPKRGNKRDDILPGMRVTNYRKRTTITFVVRDEVVEILGIWYGGQNYQESD